jgi:hypothetical protein
LEKTINCGAKPSVRAANADAATLRKRRLETVIRV